MDEEKKQCDSNCETCLMKWQIQCSARFSHRNNIILKALEEKLDKLSDSIDAIQNKIDGIFDKK